MSRSEGKAERWRQLEELLLAFPEGLHRAEIARRLGVHRSTAGRDIEELSRRIPIWEDDDGRLGINRDDYLNHVRLTIHESMALHVAARLMTTRTDKHNPHAASALRKLGNALEKFAPLVSRHLLISAEVMDSQAQRHDPVYLDVLETLRVPGRSGARCESGTSMATQGRSSICSRTVLYRAVRDRPDGACYWLARAAGCSANPQDRAHPADRAA